MSNANTYFIQYTSSFDLNNAKIEHSSILYFENRFSGPLNLVFNKIVYSSYRLIQECKRPLFWINWLIQTFFLMYNRGNRRNDYSLLIPTFAI